MRGPEAAADHVCPVLGLLREGQNRRHTYVRRKQSSSGDLKAQDTPFNLGAMDLKAGFCGQGQGQSMQGLLQRRSHSCCCRAIYYGIRPDFWLFQCCYRWKTEAYLKVTDISKSVLDNLVLTVVSAVFQQLTSHHMSPASCAPLRDTGFSISFLRGFIAFLFLQQ